MPALPLHTDAMERRDFLAAALGLAGVTLLPADVNAWPDAAEGLAQEVNVVAKAGDANPNRTVRRAATLLMDAETLLPMVPRQRLLLHRAAGTAAIVLARCQRWTGQPFGRALGLAEAHARDAGDGPIAAEVLHIRARHCGEAEHAFDLSSPICARLLTHAIEVAGTGAEGAAVRASAHFDLAWEHAAAGATTTALQHLDMASGRGEVMGTATERRGSIPRLIPGHETDAEQEFMDVLGSPCPPVRHANALTNLARMHATAGDIDAAAAALEEAWLVNRSARCGGRQWRVRAIRRGLPDIPAVRQLDGVMHGGEV